MSIDNLVRENIKQLVPYSSARSEFKGVAEVFLDANQRVILGKLPKRESQTLIEDDFEKVEWSQVGGQEKVKEEIRKVLEYPLLHEEILKEKGKK